MLGGALVVAVDDVLLMRQNQLLWNSDGLKAKGKGVSKFKEQNGYGTNGQLSDHEA
jgi:hypothetical protein